MHRRVSRRDSRCHARARRTMGTGRAGCVGCAGMRRSRLRRNLVGAFPRARCGSFRATARGESRRAVDVARGLGRGRCPHVGAARREPADDHRDRMVRRDVSDPFHRPASRTPRRRLLRATVFALPAGRRCHADVGDANAAATPRIRRIAIRDGVGARTNRRRAYRIDSYRQADPTRRTSRARTRMHQSHNARLLAQSHGLGSDFVACRSNFDERFGGIDSSCVHDRAGLPRDRRFESKQPNRMAIECESGAVPRRVRSPSIPNGGLMSPPTVQYVHSPRPTGG